MRMTTPHNNSEKNIASLLKTLEDEPSINCFQIKEMESIEASSTVELLGIKLEKNLNFNEHVSD